jgi:hypothetical protein
MNLPLTAVLTVMALAVAGCAGGGAPAAGAPPASSPTAPERAAVMNWLTTTDQMWTHNDFAGLDQITTGQMRAIYLSEEQQASLPAYADRQPFQLTGLSITIPCHTGRPTVFVAYARTDVFDLWSGPQSVAMVFERAGGLWKLATAVTYPGDKAWPALCANGAPPATPPVLAPGGYTPELAQVLTSAATGAAVTGATASPFAVNGFLAGAGSITVQSATSIRQDRRGGVSLTTLFSPAPEPTLALPLADGRGYWVIGIMTQRDTYQASGGQRAANWPDGNPVATPRPAVVHGETDTFTTTYAAIDPLGSGPASVALDGFFGWPLTSIAS